MPPSRKTAAISCSVCLNDVSLFAFTSIICCDSGISSVSSVKSPSRLRAHRSCSDSTSPELLVSNEQTPDRQSELLCPQKWYMCYQRKIIQVIQCIILSRIQRSTGSSVRKTTIHGIQTPHNIVESLCFCDCRYARLGAELSRARRNQMICACRSCSTVHSAGREGVAPAEHATPATGVVVFSFLTCHCHNGRSTTMRTCSGHDQGKLKTALLVSTIHL